VSVDLTHRQSIITNSVVLVVTVLVSILLASQVGTATELTLMHCWGDHRTPMVEAMVDQFEKEHPGVTVTTQLKSCGKPLQEAFLTAYAGGIAPDVVMISSSLIPGTVNSGALLSLSPWMTKEGINEDLWFPAEIDSGRWNGQIYGLPIRTGGDANSLMFYNIDLLDSLGIGSVPRTWDELNAMSRKIVRYEGDKIARVAFTPHGGDMPSPGWLAAGGGKLYSDDGKEILFANSAAIDLGTFLQDHFTINQQESP
jgi:multiple sugar transport system substrate-binding protein